MIRPSHVKAVVNGKIVRGILLIIATMSVLQLVILSFHLSYQWQSNDRMIMSQSWKNTLPMLSEFTKGKGGLFAKIHGVNEITLTFGRGSVLISKSSAPKCAIHYRYININDLEKTIMHARGYCFSKKIDPENWINYRFLPDRTLDTLFSIMATISLLLFFGVFCYVWLSIKIIIPLREFEFSAKSLGMRLEGKPITTNGLKVLDKASSALNFMQNKLLMALQIRTKILASLSHDLRAPVTRIKFRVQTNKMDKAALEEDVDELESVIDGILIYAKENVFANEQFKAISLNALLSTIYHQYSDMNKSITLNSPQHGVVIKAKPMALKRAIVNIVDNALKYGTKATLSFFKTDKLVVITVIDDGPGIPDHEIGNAFKSFHQINNSAAGVGLGLSIVQEIVHYHHGKIQLKNIKGGGLCVKIKLPI